MGTMHRIADLTSNLNWYVRNVNFGRDGQHAKFPNAEFPRMLAIHTDHLKTSGIWIRIRKFVEQSLGDAVLIDYISRSYWYEYGGQNPWDHNGYSIDNDWYRFWFESETDMVLFNLQFRDLIQPISAEHPDGLHPAKNGNRPMDEFGNYKDW